MDSTLDGDACEGCSREIAISDRINCPYLLRFPVFVVLISVFVLHLHKKDVATIQTIKKKLPTK